VSIEHQKSFKLHNIDASIIFSVFDNKLLFIHSQFTSTQFALDEFGIRVEKYDDFAQVALMFKGGENYLSLLFNGDEFDSLVKYFRVLGYPVPVMF